MKTKEKELIAEITKLIEMGQYNSPHPFMTHDLIKKISGDIYDRFESEIASLKAEQSQEGEQSSPKLICNSWYYLDGVKTCNLSHCMMKRIDCGMYVEYINTNPNTAQEGEQPERTVVEILTNLSQFDSDYLLKNDGKLLISPATALEAMEEYRNQPKKQ